MSQDAARLFLGNNPGQYYDIPTTSILQSVNIEAGSLIRQDLNDNIDTPE